MTSRSFHHRYTPAGQGTDGLDPITLTTTDIGEAAIREIVQISLTSAPFGVFLEQLLVPGDAWFRWITQLGQIRETRTALSGLFGRFVARAYLTRYCGFHYFEPIKADLQVLAAWPYFTVHKKATGDLPDWIAASAAGANAFAIAEAKGSHNAQGPTPSLNAAKAQAARIDILASGMPLVVKRYAVVTRWSVQGNASLNAPYLWVDDPDDGVVEPTADDIANVARGVRLGHYATMAEGLGLHETAAAIRRAKGMQSGSLDLPRREQVHMTVDGGDPYPVLAAAIVPNGIVPLPRDGDLDAFRGALSTVFGEKTLIVAVRTDAIVAADRGEDRKIVASPTSEDAAFWRRRRIQADGSEQIPLAAAALIRTPTG